MSHETYKADIPFRAKEPEQACKIRRGGICRFQTTTLTRCLRPRKRATITRHLTSPVPARSKSSWKRKMVRDNLRYRLATWLSGRGGSSNLTAIDSPDSSGFTKFTAPPDLPVSSRVSRMSYLRESRPPSLSWQAP